MQAVAGGVAHGVDVLVEVGVGRRVEEELVEDAEDGDGVRGRADAEVVVANGGVCHLRFGVLVVWVC